MLGEFTAAHGKLWGQGASSPATENRPTPRAPPLHKGGAQQLFQHSISTAPDGLINHVVVSTA
jgi:hypothetical protein